MDVTQLQQRVEALQTKADKLAADLTARATARKAMTDKYTADCAAFDAETQAMVNRSNECKSDLSTAKQVLAAAEADAAKLAAEQTAMQAVKDENTALKARVAELEAQLKPAEPPVVEEP
jgi:chromosome segregation ATPase